MEYWPVLEPDRLFSYLTVNVQIKPQQHLIFVILLACVKNIQLLVLLQCFYFIFIFFIN
jgi:hypothetical protein